MYFQKKKYIFCFLRHAYRSGTFSFGFCYFSLCCVIVKHHCNLFIFQCPLSVIEKALQDEYAYKSERKGRGRGRLLLEQSRLRKTSKVAMKPLPSPVDVKTVKHILVSIKYGYTVTNGCKRITSKRVVFFPYATSLFTQLTSQRNHSEVQNCMWVKFECHKMKS